MADDDLLAARPGQDIRHGGVDSLCKLGPGLGPLHSLMMVHPVPPLCGWRQESIVKPGLGLAISHTLGLLPQSPIRDGGHPEHFGGHFGGLCRPLQVRGVHLHRFPGGNDPPQFRGDSLGVFPTLRGQL